MKKIIMSLLVLLTLCGCTSYKDVTIEDENYYMYLYTENNGADIVEEHTVINPEGKITNMKYIYKFDGDKLTAIKFISTYPDAEAAIKGRDELVGDSGFKGVEKIEGNVMYCDFSTSISKYDGMSKKEIWDYIKDGIKHQDNFYQHKDCGGRIKYVGNLFKECVCEGCGETHYSIFQFDYEHIKIK